MFDSQWLSNGYPCLVAMWLVASILDSLCCVLCLVTPLCPTLCDPMDCSTPGFSVYRDSPGKNTGVGIHFPTPGVFPTQGSNPGLLHCRQILYQTELPGKPLDSLATLKESRLLRAVLGSQKNWVRSTEFVWISSTSSTHTASLTLKIPHQSSAFVLIAEPTLTHHNHSNPIVYIRLHSWRCKFYGFSQMYNNMNPLLECHGPKSLCSASSSLPPYPLVPGNHWAFYCLHGCAFSWMAYNWNHIICSLFTLTFSLSNMHLLPPCLFTTW